MEFIYVYSGVEDLVGKKNDYHSIDSIILIDNVIEIIMSTHERWGKANAETKTILHCSKNRGVKRAMELKNKLLSYGFLLIEGGTNVNS
jgi:hypothetical protein